jgi:hypothetical protein
LVNVINVKKEIKMKRLFVSVLFFAGILFSLESYATEIWYLTYPSSPGSTSVWTHISGTMPNLEIFEVVEHAATGNMYTGEAEVYRTETFFTANASEKGSAGSHEEKYSGTIDSKTGTLSGTYYTTAGGGPYPFTGLIVNTPSPK